MAKMSVGSVSFPRLQQQQTLGNWIATPQSFPQVEDALSQCRTETFLAYPPKSKTEAVNQLLLELIQQMVAPCFLLPHIVDFLDRVHREHILDHHYTFQSFELFLNQLSSISIEENYLIRGKIVGKVIPRESYQVLFPVGMGKVYPGSHFVTAHNSPDLDTTIASYWGWIDAFGCRISENFHIWNLPGGAPEGQMEIQFLFHQMFGDGVFLHLAKTRTALGITGIDLLTQKGMHRTTASASFLDIEQGRMHHATVLVDSRGYYLGDWHNIDIESVRHVIMLLWNCLLWFEQHFHLALIGLFTRVQLSVHDLDVFLQTMLSLQIVASPPAKDFTEKQKRHLQLFLIKILGIQEGMATSFGCFAQRMAALHVRELQHAMDKLSVLTKSSLFDSRGQLVEHRPQIFTTLEQITIAFDQGIMEVKTYFDRLDIGWQIQSQVLGFIPQSVSSRADLEEIRSKIGDRTYLTVTATDHQGERIPLGIIPATDLYRPILGTVTLRDFCNREETKIPTYLEVISVIDHHKSTLHTSSTPVVMISDAQSSNGIVAEMAFKINDAFGLGGMTKQEVDQQVQDTLHNLRSMGERRVLSRLLQRQMIAEKNEPYFIAPEREFIEYMHFLFAILDDTDLLTKVSPRDLDVVASLLNRMKSLAIGKEIEAVHFDTIPKGKEFITKATRRILEDPDMYSLYKKIYTEKEQAIDQNICACAQRHPSPFFADTKEQNGCCRVGQTKIFSINAALFQQHATQIRAFWYDEARAFYRERAEIDLHIHMISTIYGADEVYRGIVHQFAHCDEMWIWIPPQDTAITHLKTFLNGFRVMPQIQQILIEVEFLGENAQELGQFFRESFVPSVQMRTADTGSLPIAVIRYVAGAVNSRKAQVTPYLPRLV